MRELHDLEPAIRPGLLGRNDVPHALHQDFAASTGDGVQSCGLQFTNDLDRVHPEHGAEEVHFAR
jgi:hypothetical protein